MKVLNVLQNIYHVTPAQIQELHNIRLLNPALPYINKRAELSTKHQKPINTYLADKIERVIYNKREKKTLSAWYINPDKSENVVVFIHGLGKNITNYQDLYEQIVKNGMGVYAIEYRGHGINPKAKVTEYNMSNDVKKAFAYLTHEKQIKPENIVVIGHSMGGVLASNLVAKQQGIKSMILVSPLCNLHNLGEKFVLNKKVGLGFPKIIYDISKSSKLLKWLQSMHFNTLKLLRDNKVPLTIIHSEADTVTNIRGSRKIAGLTRIQGNNIIFEWFKKGGHDIDSSKIEYIIKRLRTIYNLPKPLNIEA